MSIELARRPFTIEEYEQMIDQGILRQDERLELLEGEIVEMAPIGGRHGGTIIRLYRIFARLAIERRADVSIQNPLRLGSISMPQPDLQLLEPSASGYSEHPDTSQLLMVLEVSDSTLQEDKQRKVPLYASAGIRECWIVDLVNNQIEQYRVPDAEGRVYREIRIHRRGDKLAPLAFPDYLVAVNEVLGEG